MERTCNKYALYIGVKTGNNAGSKAVNDALAVADKLGYQGVRLYTAKKTKTTVGNVLQGLCKLICFAFKVKKGDVVFIQYPVNRFLLKKIYSVLRSRGARIITLIHDVDYLRERTHGKDGVEGMKSLEISLLSQSNVVICHNQKMMERLQEDGLQAELVNLGIFDYLYEGKSAERTADKHTLIVAGNLLKQKAGYLYRLSGDKQAFNLSLYGSNLEEGFDYPNATHYGSFSPDELIEKLKGAYGLVWDGDSLCSCEGSYGAYLKINNPHKVSLYLAAGLPVIVWKQSALYSFVSENGVGFGVDSLEELDEALTQNESAYDGYCQCVEQLQFNLKNGAYMQAAIERAETLCGVCGGEDERV